MNVSNNGAPPDAPAPFGAAARSGAPAWFDMSAPAGSAAPLGASAPAGSSAPALADPSVNRAAVDESCERGAATALRSRYHLACVSGPDRGSVVPLVAGGDIGRGTFPHLRDPHLSRQHVTCEAERPGFRLRRGCCGVLRNQSRVNPQAWPGGRIRVYPGSRVHLGSGLWEVRTRPQSLEWPLPPVRAGRGAWRLLPLVMLPLLLWRLLRLPGVLFLLALVGCATALLVSWLAANRRRGRRFDGAFLLLVYAALNSAGGPTPRQPPARGPSENVTQTRLWLSRVGGRKVTLGSDGTLGLVGPGSQSAAHWIAAQLCAAHPSLKAAAGPPTEAGGSLQLLAPAAAATPTGAAAGGSRATAEIHWASTIEDVPARVTRILRVSPRLGAHWRLPSGSDGQDALPECVSFTDVGLPVPFQSRAYPAAAAQILTAWQQFEQTSEPWRVPVATREPGGSTARQIVSLDLLSDGPHALLVGGTGSGKSGALQTWLWALAAQLPPARLRMALIDYKGGSTFKVLESLPHVDVSASDMDPSGGSWLLSRLQRVLHRRKQQLAAAGYADLPQWEAASLGDAPPRMLLVIDEFQALAAGHDGQLAALYRLAAQGRSLGLHLILSTQRLSADVGADLRATVDLRVALRATEAMDAIAVTGSPAAAKLPRVPGRAVVNGSTIQFAHHEFSAEQMAFLMRSVMTDWTGLAADSARAGLSAADAVWPQRLPDRLTPAQLSAANDTLGPASEPAELAGQRNAPVFAVTEAAHGPLTRLRLPQGPLLLAGPSSVAEELGNLASALVGLRGAAVTVIGGGEEIDTGYVAEQLELLAGGRSLYPPTANGQATADFTAPVHATLVLEPASIGRAMEGAGVGLEFTRLWRQIVAQPRATSRLIVVDTEASGFSTRLHRRLFRLPSAACWRDPALLRLLPPLAARMPASADPTPVQGETATPVSGRVLAVGLTPHPVMAQLPTDWAEKRRRDVGRRAGSSDWEAREALRRATTRIRRLLVVGPGPSESESLTSGISDLGLGGVEVERANLPAGLPALLQVFDGDPDRMHGAAVAWRPGRDAIAALARAFPAAAFRLRACGTLGRGQAILIVPSVVRRIDWEAA